MPDARESARHELEIGNRFSTLVVGISRMPGSPGNLYRAIVLDGSHLELVRERLNPFDSEAICIREAGTANVLGYLRSDVAKRLAPRIDEGEIWVVGKRSLEVAEGHENFPGLTLHLDLEKIEWAADFEFPLARPLEPVSRFDLMRKRTSREDPRAFADRMTRLAEGLEVHWVTDQQYAVPSATQSGKFHAVVMDPDEHALVWCLCDCQSGACRPFLPVACRHGAAVVAHLVETGYLRQIGGLAYKVD